MEEKQELTLGQQRVGVNFNPSQKEEIKVVKERIADVIDYLEAFKNGLAVLPENQNLSPVGYRDKYAETFRAIALAQTKLEEASMWAVKAVTK